MAMRKGVVTVHGVPTFVATWGAWIDDDLNAHRDVIVCFPGNPGVTGYYEEFLQALYESLNFPVWIVSHAGHEVGRDMTIPPFATNRDLFSLHGQIKHKTEFLKKYVPPHLNIHLIGHSIGSYMALQILKQCPEINARVKRAYLLFPAIQRLKDTPSGKFWATYMIPFAAFFIFLSWFFILLPVIIRKLLIYCYFVLQPAKKEMIRPSVKLLNPRALRNVFFIAKDNLEHVHDLDHDLIGKLSDKLLFYFSTKDGWVPISCYEDIKKSHPDVLALTTNHPHAFVLYCGSEVASCVSKWIKSYSSKMKTAEISS